MASDELKDTIVRYCDGKKSDWKRVGKRTVKYLGEDCTLRTFKNDVLNMAVWMLGDDPDQFPIEGEKLCYYLTLSDMMCFEGPTISFGVAGKDEIYDQHVSDAISAIFNFPDWVELDEHCENMCTMIFDEGKTIEDFKEFLHSVGMQFAGSLDD